jgi:hypothetical protein
MKTTIDMAREVYGAHTEWSGAPLDRLEQLVAIVRADEQEKYKWDIHSCGPTCKRYACVAMREAVEAEREACAKVVEDLEGCAQYFPHVPDIIRNRGNT